jgi:hypothetical protein
VFKRDPDTGNGDHTREKTPSRCVDDGVEDKRILVVETEFASTLRVAARDGNTLSAVARQAWDRGDLRILTKNSPAAASDGHVSIMGHVTSDELLRYLTRTEMANGFANRFLWFLVRRSKRLPDGGLVPGTEINRLAARLMQVLRAARDIEEVRRDDRASVLWREVYEDLSRPRRALRRMRSASLSSTRSWTVRL